MEEQYELKRHHIEIDRDLQMDDENENAVVAYIATYFDVDEKFGTCTKDDDSAWVNFYGRYDTETGVLTTFYYVETDESNDYHEYVPGENEKKLIIEMMQETCCRECGCSMEEWVRSLQEDNSMKGLVQ